MAFAYRCRHLSGIFFQEPLSWAATLQNAFSITLLENLLTKSFCLAGLLEYINTEISTSKQKKFPLVTFVDTPGLVDGDMNYPFDVNQAMLWLGDLVDLIFVFFDPIGQVRTIQAL